MQQNSHTRATELGPPCMVLNWPVGVWPAVYLEDVSLSIVLALNQNDLQVEMAPVW